MTISAPTGLSFINALNDTYVTPVPDLAAYGWDIAGPGWEALSPTGEICAFVDEADAKAWRLASCRAFVGADDEPSYPTCPIHGAGCAAWR